MGLLDGIAANVTAPGGQLTEEDFFAGMRQAMRYAPPRPHVVTSTAVVRRGREEGRRWRERADDARREYRRLPRWRWIRRLRALQRFEQAVGLRDGFESMFGR